MTTLPTLASKGLTVKSFEDMAAQGKVTVQKEGGQPRLIEGKHSAFGHKVTHNFRSAADRTAAKQANQHTIQHFIAAVRQERGAAAAEHAISVLSERYESGRPLSKTAITKALSPYNKDLSGTLHPAYTAAMGTELTGDIGKNQSQTTVTASTGKEFQVYSSFQTDLPRNITKIGDNAPVTRKTADPGKTGARQLFELTGGNERVTRDLSYLLTQGTANTVVLGLGQDHPHTGFPLPGAPQGGDVAGGTQLAVAKKDGYYEVTIRSETKPTALQQYTGENRGITNLGQDSSLNYHISLRYTPAEDGVSPGIVSNVNMSYTANFKEA